MWIRLRWTPRIASLIASRKIILVAFTTSHCTHDGPPTLAFPSFNTYVCATIASFSLKSIHCRVLLHAHVTHFGSFRRTPHIASSSSSSSSHNRVYIAQENQLNSDFDYALRDSALLFICQSVSMNERYDVD